MFLLGFALDQFNFYDPAARNLVFFKSDKHEVPCRITQTDVSDKRIGCETECVSSDCLTLLNAKRNQASVSVIQAT